MGDYQRSAYGAPNRPATLTAEFVAEKIIEAIQTEAAEVSAENA